MTRESDEQMIQSQGLTEDLHHPERSLRLEERPEESNT